MKTNYLENQYQLVGSKRDVIVESSIKWNAGYSEDVLSLYK